MEVSATFSDMSAILWQSVVFLEETGISGESHLQTLSQNVVSSTHQHKLTNLVVRGIDSTIRFKSNYHHHDHDGLQKGTTQLCLILYIHTFHNTRTDRQLLG